MLFYQHGLPENGTIEGLWNEILHFHHIPAEISRKFLRYNDDFEI